MLDNGNISALCMFFLAMAMIWLGRTLGTTAVLAIAGLLAIIYIKEITKKGKGNGEYN